MILLIDSYGRITDLQCVAGSVFNEGDFGLKGTEVDREIGGSHLLAKKCFHVIVTSMYDYFISRNVSRGEKRNALNMIIMKMGHKKMECLVRQTIRHNFVTQNPQSGPSIKNEPIVGTGVYSYARSIASESGSLVKRQNFLTNSLICDSERRSLPLAPRSADTTFRLHQRRWGQLESILEFL